MANRRIPPCKCGPEHWRGGHSKGHCWEGSSFKPVVGSFPPTAVETPVCPCTRYRPALRATRTLRRSINRYAKTAEQVTAEKLGWERVGNRGRKNFDIRRKDGNLVTHGGEVKHGPWKALFNALDQVRSVPCQGSPRRLVFIVEKAGQGKRGRTLVCEEIDDWIGWNGTA